MTEDRADMVLVPRVPTEAMNTAGYQEWNRLRAGSVDLIYRAMIDASPIPVAGKDEIERLRAIVQVIADADSEDCIGSLDVDIPNNGYPRQWLRDAARAALHHPNVGDKMGDDK